MSHEHHGALDQQLVQANIKTSKHHFTGPLWEETTGDWIPLTQRDNNAESFSMSWCHHELGVADDVTVPCFLQWKLYIDGLVQDCSNSSALAMELLQSCTKPSVSYH